MIRSLAVFAALVVVLLAVPDPADARTVTEALAAYRDNRVAEAERILAAVVADSAAAPRDRAEALRALGRIDGLLRGETDAMAAAIAEGPTGGEHCATAALALRVYRDAGAPAIPLPYAASASVFCTPDEIDLLRVELARTHLAIGRSSAAERDTRLAAAAGELAAIDPAARSVPAVASVRLALALERRDAAAAFAAWRDYFWLVDTDAPQALAAVRGRVETIFEQGLSAVAPVAARLALADMLVRVGFTEDAHAFAVASGLPAQSADMPAWRRLAAFFVFHDQVRAAALRANREMASGGRAQWYEAEIGAARDRLMQDAGLSGDPVAALAAGFGVFGSLGETGGYPSLHAGHLVQDEEIQVEQYGRHGAFPFRVIDNMLSNGFQSWLWDGWAQTGGWFRNNEIVQVRSAYTRGSLRAWRLAQPGPARDRFVAQIAGNAATERAALGRDGLAQLHATADTLELQAIDQIAARAPDPTAFMREHWQATIEYSIVRHEGRHALDRQEGVRGSDAELEYRAKLSQIALSRYPRLGLANVAGLSVDGPGHGRANLRILRGFRDWMRAHRHDVIGFDPALPSLAQLHLLTDDQIRAVTRSMDPWAR